ncbi:MAG: hypothetical protein AcusKO_18000 [Acuticoccus sp.]
MAPVLIHLHVPKCRGSSINRALGRRFRPRCFTKTANNERYQNYLKKSPAARDTRYDAVVGHLLYGEHERFTRPCLYISATRDPIERLCSLFNHIQTRRDHPYHAYLREHLPDLNELSRMRLFNTDLRGQFTERFNRTYARPLGPAGDPDANRAMVVEEVRAGRMLIAPFETITAFLSALGITEIPTLNVTDLRDPQGFVPARAQDLTPRVRRLLEQQFCKHDYRLLEAIAAVAPTDGAQFARAAGFGDLTVSPAPAS